MPLVFAGPGMALRKPSPKARSAGNWRNPGRLFFGYFLLAKQKKVARLSVREPTLKQSVAIATLVTKNHRKNNNVYRSRNP